MLNSEEPKLTSALFDWVNSFNPPRLVESWRDLRDGKIVWEILREVDPIHFCGAAPEQDSGAPADWIPRWQNLKHIHRLVVSYLVDVCDQIPELSKKMEIDLKTIASDASAGESAKVRRQGSPKGPITEADIVKLLKLVVVAAFTSPTSGPRVAQKSLELGNKTAGLLVEVIKQMHELDSRLVDAKLKSETEGSSDMENTEESELRSSTRGTSTERDSELENEEKFLKAEARIKDLENKLQNSVYEVRDVRLQNESLTEQFRAYKQEAEDKNKGLTTTIEGRFRVLQAQTAKDSDLIAALESDLAKANEKVDELNRQLSRNNAGETSLQDLRDSLQEVTAERDELSQKVKANDNLKKKIQSLQHLEREHANLSEINKAQKIQIEEHVAIRERNSKLVQAEYENAVRSRSQEATISDQRSLLERLKEENKTLMQQKYHLKTQQDRDERAIAELNSKVQQYEAGQGSPRSDHGGTLDDELDFVDTRYEENLVLRSLFKWNHSVILTMRSKAASGESEEASTLRQKLSVADGMVLDLLDEKRGLLDELNARNPDEYVLVAGKGSEELIVDPTRQPAYLTLQEKLQVTEQKLRDHELRCYELTAKLAGIEHQPSRPINEAGSDGETLAQQYQELQRRNADVVINLAEHKSLLVQAIARARDLQRSYEAKEGAATVDWLKNVQDLLNDVAKQSEENDEIQFKVINAKRNIEVGRVAWAEAGKVGHTLNYSLPSPTRRHHRFLRPFGNKPRGRSSIPSAQSNRDAPASPIVSVPRLEVPRSPVVATTAKKENRRSGFFNFGR
ncbi:hypothetical protein LTR50_002285 [Elasticomyces elasticus]|nr:hypothetical protein LTR50_002285 [Elasticomyces elasticus]